MLRVHSLFSRCSFNIEHVTWAIEPSGEISPHSTDMYKDKTHSPKTIFLQRKLLLLEISTRHWYNIAYNSFKHLFGDHLLPDPRGSFLIFDLALEKFEDNACLDVIIDILSCVGRSWRQENTRRRDMLTTCKGLLPQSVAAVFQSGKCLVRKRPFITFAFLF